MVKLVECVPNFSEGRDQAVIHAIAGAIRSVQDVSLLDVDAGFEFNRTVYTFVGTEGAVFEAAVRATKVGVPLIDMTIHKGEHPRMGALDVMPFIPIGDTAMEECVELSKRFGRRMAEELGVPVFLYAYSATRPDRVRLPDIRKGEYEALAEKFKNPLFAPDFGSPVFVPKSGATATGAREILIAYNVNLGTNKKSVASEIAGKIRTSGTVKKDENGKVIVGSDGAQIRIPGRFDGVQASGMMYNEDIAQISMNLLNYRKVSLHHVYEAIKEEAAILGVSVTGSEIVGLVPKDALLKVGLFYVEREGIPPPENERALIEIAIDRLCLSQLYPFNPDQKIIEYLVEKRTLVSLSLKQFLSELASTSPAPGGGSAAALSGALGSALSSMVCNLTIGKKKYEDVQNEIKILRSKSERIRCSLMELVDKDTDAFNTVIRAFKMPKETITEQTKRTKAIQEAYKSAAFAPFVTAQLCFEVVSMACNIATKGNKNSITDVGAAAIMARAGFYTAILNVRINLKEIKDEIYVKQMHQELSEMEGKIEQAFNDTLDIVEQWL